MLQEIEAKLKNIVEQLEKSAANHNFLLGAKAALENLYEATKGFAPAAEAVVAVVDPAIAPAVDASVSTVEAVVEAAQEAIPAE